MSVQTDCEMLSVQAMEAYAGKYHVSGNDVVIGPVADGKEDFLCQK